MPKAKTQAAWGAKLCALLAALSTSAAAIPLTRIQDTLYNADGTAIEGSATIQWRGFTASDGSTVAGSSITVSIVQGVLAIDLTPTEDATPAGVTYQVSFLLDNGSRYSETWVVPQNASPVTVSQVRVSPPPAAGSSIGQAQVTGLVAALDAKAGLVDANVFQGSQTVKDNGIAPSAPLLALEEEGSSESVGFRLPNLSQSTVYTLPSTDGVAGQGLTTDGSGNLFWSVASGQGGDLAYEIIQDDGTSLTQRNIANFHNGLQASDNAGQTAPT